MKKSERNLLVSAALLIGVLIAAIGFVNAMAVLMWLAVAAIVCVSANIIFKSIKEMVKGEKRV